MFFVVVVVQIKLTSEAEAISGSVSEMNDRNGIGSRGFAAFSFNLLVIIF